MTPPPIPSEAGFDTRWAAWLLRGEAHERRVRRRAITSAAVLALAAAAVYAAVLS